jgi:hypothetical protein
MFDPDALSRIHFSTDPFVFGTVEGFFSETFLASLESRLEKALIDFIPSRITSPLMTFSSGEMPDREFWRDVEDALTAEELSSSFYRKFGVDWPEQFIVKKGIAVHVESQGAKLLPHTDSAWDPTRSPSGPFKPCVFSLQIYLPVDLDDESLGTCLYEKSTDGNFLERRKIPYRRNLLFAFRPGPQTFHGFDELSLGGRLRTSIVVRHNLFPREMLETLRKKMAARIQVRP